MITNPSEIQEIQTEARRELHWRLDRLQQDLRNVKALSLLCDEGYLATSAGLFSRVVERVQKHA